MVLRKVRVLILVDKDIAEPLAVFFEHVGVLLEQADRAQQKIVEIERVRILQPLFIDLERFQDLHRLSRFLQKCKGREGVVFRV